MKHDIKTRFYTSLIIKTLTRGYIMPKSEPTILLTISPKSSSEQNKEKTVHTVSTQPVTQLENYTSNSKRITKETSSQPGCFSRLFCCCFTSPEEQEQIIKNKQLSFFLSKTNTYEKRIQRELGKTPEAFENRKELIISILSSFETSLIALICNYDNDFQLAVGMSILGKITTKDGDSVLTYIGSEIAQLLHYEIPDLLTQDISTLFVHQEFAKKHKEFLAQFVESANPSSEKNKSSRCPFLTTAPRGERNFPIIDGQGNTVNAKFELKTFAIRKVELTKEEQDINGIYTLAQFFSIDASKQEKKEEKINLSTRSY